jgi:hypothetical protein
VQPSKQTFANKKRVESKVSNERPWELHFFLGMEVERNHDEQLLCINQIKYLHEILKRF